MSAETVKEMLIGLSHQAKSKSLTIAISGVAGPKRSENKQVGLVYIGAKVTYDNSEVINEFNFGNIDRNIIQQRSVHKALIIALDLIKKVNKSLFSCFGLKGLNNFDSNFFKTD